jgi:hypothetical protein
MLPSGVQMRRSDARSWPRLTGARGAWPKANRGRELVQRHEPSHPTPSSRPEP